MPDGYYVIPPNSTGERIRTRDKGAAVGMEQYVALAGLPTYWVFTPAAAGAANKNFLSMLNAAGSGQVIKVRKLFLISAYMGAAVTGVALDWQWKRITAITGGTAVVPNPVDTADGALSNFTCVTNPTSVTEGINLFDYFTNNDERLLTDASSRSMWEQFFNILLEGNEQKEFTLNPGEGATFKHVTSSTLAPTWSILAALTRE